MVKSLLIVNSKLFNLLIKARDEAHRFAIKANRNAKRKNMQVSILDSIKGIGPKTKERLFNEFKSIDAILNSDINHLQKIKGVDQRIANEIKKLNHHEKFYNATDLFKNFFGPLIFVLSVFFEMYLVSLVIFILCSISDFLMAILQENLIMNHHLENF